MIQKNDKAAGKMKQLLTAGNDINTHAFDTYSIEQAKLKGKLSIQTDPDNSKIKYATIRRKCSVEWRIFAAQKGLYELRFGYRIPPSDRMLRLNINGRQSKLAFTYRNTWYECRRDTILKKGNNIITLWYDEQPVGISYLKVSRKTIHVKPNLTPKMNAFYTCMPGDVFIKIENRNHKLLSIHCEGEKVPYKAEEYKYLEDTEILKIPKRFLKKLKPGEKEFQFAFSRSIAEEFQLNIISQSEPAPLTIIVFDVIHGNSTLFVMPTGKIIMVDSGEESVARKILIPFLDRHGIKKIDQYILSHFHPDHDGAIDDIIKKYKIKSVKTNRDFKTGEVFELEGTCWKILNSFLENEPDENTNSLSFKLEYKGFIYTDGGDLYGHTMQSIMKKFPKDIKAHVYNADHHFHGSTDAGYLIKTDPYLFLVSGEYHVYQRTYMDAFKDNTLHALKRGKGRFIDDLLTCEVGHIVLRVYGKDQWSYETYKDRYKAEIPYLL